VAAEGAFYDELAAYYHLLFEDWDASIRQQGEQLSRVIDARWPSARQVLDVACGIGTQSLALAQRNYIVVGSDVSDAALHRARDEARRRDLKIAFSHCDMRDVHKRHGDGFDVVVCADNSLPHLLTDEEILLSLREMRECLRPGGGCLITVRDYAVLNAGGRGRLVPYPVRETPGRRCILFQQLDFRGDYCSVRFCVVDQDLVLGRSDVHVMKTHYYAITTDRLCALMREAGFTAVERLDGAFYQPVLVGTR
jgi:SAM-dependent methyltransferase